MRRRSQAFIGLSGVVALLNAYSAITAPETAVLNLTIVLWCAIAIFQELMVNLERQRAERWRHYCLGGGES